MPQTTEQVVRFILEKISGKKCGKDFGLAYNPEFIALGSVIHDFLNPDMLLIGEANKVDGDILEYIYKKTCDNNPYFARMSLVNAEITKIALNCYVTTKITFANSLSEVCEKVKGGDAHVVSEALGMDSRIGSKYIRPGLGYGGPCFPRDNQAFACFARLMETQAKLAEKVDEVNRDQVMRVLNRIKELIGSSRDKKAKKHIAVLGLSYKPNTPIIEDSQALNIAHMLVNEGYSVSVYDPQAMENARSVLGDAVSYARGPQECISGADLAILAVPWKEFAKIDLKKADKKMVLLDCWQFFPDKDGITVRSLGKG
jgi:UDPglucose 6-dehydrogenase